MNVGKLVVASVLDELHGHDSNFQYLQPLSARCGFHGRCEKAPLSWFRRASRYTCTKQLIVKVLFPLDMSGGSVECRDTGRTAMAGIRSPRGPSTSRTSSTAVNAS